MMTNAEAAANLREVLAIAGAFSDARVTCETLQLAIAALEGPGMEEVARFERYPGRPLDTLFETADICRDPELMSVSARVLADAHKEWIAFRDWADAVLALRGTK